MNWWPVGGVTASVASASQAALSEWTAGFLEQKLRLPAEWVAEALADYTAARAQLQPEATAAGARALLQPQTLSPFRPQASPVLKQSSGRAAASGHGAWLWGNATPGGGPFAGVVACRLTGSLKDIGISKSQTGGFILTYETDIWRQQIDIGYWVPIIQTAIFCVALFEKSIKNKRGDLQHWPAPPLVLAKM